jgi:hypothetical protein
VINQATRLALTAFMIELDLQIEAINANRSLHNMLMREAVLLPASGLVLFEL